ncbi:MAG: hydantoinase B/oxoprolinase family protein [Aromatoleum sp.]|jgi:N-methylhydantoinase B|uniref:hydantoinase B/oxoprolinase family protein n=1 Tax=Aromatoleum sp. TaxID=2307007 RepID=UPI002893D0D5|nr:hydantoinase B/oxoprolinase family protein [Aromatoleum sp.]MDT3671830.1 hydantoinase B/oxoprolinase family protein [Aromatoleum sp.]
MTQIDPITVATTWHALQRICKEMRQTIERTATNVLATTLHDLAYGIWDAKGQAIAIPEGFPCRLVSSSFQIKAVQKQFGDKIYPGDVFLTNHPFDAGAVHLPDWVFVRPIFYGNELVLFTCMGTHVPDSGGAMPGAYFLAHDSIAEGLNIPPVKLVERGEVREDVLGLLLANNRLPDMMRREIRSLVGSTALAEKRAVELFDRYGRDTVFACLDEMIRRTEKAVRSEITKWPDGSWYAEAQTDDDGAEIGKPVTVRCRLTIKGDEATFDFSDSDEQVKGYANVGYSVTQSMALATAFMFLDPALAAYHNEGTLRPFNIVAAEGTVTNCRRGSLVAAAPSLVGHKIIECVLATLSQALPQRALAAYPGPFELMFLGNDPRTNEFYVYVSFCPDAGAGAVYGHDGYQCFACGPTLGVAAKADAEEEMVRFPWRVTRYEFMTDSHGAGKWRSAPGVIWEGVNEGSDCVSNLGPADGWHTQGQGQQGGSPSVLNKGYIVRGEDHIEIKEPHVGQQLKTGDVFVAKAGGGAGVGRPEERDPEAVRMDVKNELVSIEMARNVYKVVLDPGTFEIYESATAKLRASAAAGQAV